MDIIVTDHPDPNARGLILALVLPLLSGAGRILGSEKKADVKATVVQEERISYLDNGALRIGVNLDLGGAITYLATARSQLNLINSHDWGRQIQMSHYSGPTPFAPEGKQPHQASASLGWNPIQSGDVYRHRSTVLEHRNDGYEMYTRCTPMQWPLDNDPCECTFESWIRLKDNTVVVRCRLINKRADQTQYPGRHQELPAVYTNGPWYRLLTYQGDKPFTNDALTTIPAKFPWLSWAATENWAALVNDDNWGLGIWNPGAFHFIGGFAGKPGAGGPKDGPTGYIAPLHTEIIDHNIVYEYEYVLIPGSIEEIRRTIYALSPRNAPPAYRFEKDRQHWSYVNAVDTGWPIQGELKVWLQGNNPYLVGPAGFWRADKAPKLYIEAAYRTEQKQARVWWKRHDEPGFSAAKSRTFTIRPDGQYHLYEIVLEASREYRGVITGLRFDPVPTGKAGDFIRIKSIALVPPHSS